MGLIHRFINYLQGRGKNFADEKKEDKSELIKRMDGDLLPNGWKKYESKTRVTYTKELSESVSEIFNRYDRIRFS